MYWAYFKYPSPPQKKKDNCININVRTPSTQANSFYEHDRDLQALGQWLLTGLPRNTSGAPYFPSVSRGYEQNNDYKG